MCKNNCRAKFVRFGWFVICLFISFVHAKPMEPYNECLVILVHGVNPNYKDPAKVYPQEKKATNIWDNETELDSDNKADFGDLKSYLVSELGMDGHVFEYNFDNPAETYYSYDQSQMSLSKQLGKRDFVFTGKGKKRLIA